MAKLYGSPLLVHLIVGVQLIKNQQVSLELIWHVGLYTNQNCSALVWMSTEMASKQGCQNHAPQKGHHKGFPEVMCSLNRLTQIGNRCILMQGCELPCLVALLKIGNGGKVCQKLDSVQWCCM
uniref:Uncharacterized protein n=1 Tax=Eutreptiella gymnastica TaxID=73025 RepID=A0A7S4G1J7_9EUGL